VNNDRITSIACAGIAGVALIVAVTLQSTHHNASAAIAYIATGALAGIAFLQAEITTLREEKKNLERALRAAEMRNRYHTDTHVKWAVRKQDRNT